ncbi:sugar-binding protein [uncultured Bifidobacterium sp.]|uniref:sugar-binding protein n=1 Tax=uncultured Bifidobacterium sp. TaxID=165187 RepID=UPI0027DB17FC|nr:sugar-binding protein [uncultured Bifidobacterium sp.]
MVNETVNDGDDPATNGMRNSLWYQTYGGEDYIYDAFRNANTYLNDVYAADDAEHPVTLFINDYSTEQAGKRSRYKALVERMIDQGVPFDGIGHQFHVSLTTASSNLDDALTDMSSLGKKQAITELDVATGTPVTEAKLIEQGRYYYNVNQIIHRHADQLFSVSVWGLSDDQSWRNKEGAPLLFDENLNRKPAYVGYIGDEDNLPEPMKSAIVFKDPSATVDSPLPGTEPRNGASSPWERLPLIRLNAWEDGTVAGTFNAYWNDGKLTVYVDAVDATKSDGDSVTVRVGDAEYVIGRSSAPAAADVASKVVEGDGGYELVVTVPCPDAVDENAAVGLNVIVKDGDSGQAAAWDTNPTGTVTLVESLSYTEAVKVPADVEAPKIDADASDAAWDDADEVALDKVTSGTPEATATAKTLWSDGKLYVLVKVNDADIDLDNSNPYENDSVEVFIDRGNTKSGQYTDNIQQIRVSADGQELSFGAGAAEDVQKSRVRTAGREVDGGYVVEMAIDLGEAAAGTFEGVDFQINDAKDGARIGIRNWADPTGVGYQTASHWGVLRLLADSSETETPGDEKPGDEKPGDEKPRPSDDADNDDKMPQTGSAVIGVAVVALLLVAAGCGLVIARRR